MSFATLSVGLFAALIAGSGGQTIGMLPSTYPVLSFGFGCNGIYSSLVVVCQLSTNYSNTVFTLGNCVCNGNGCDSFGTKLNNINNLRKACKIELYETIIYNNRSVIQYTSLSHIKLKINGTSFTSRTYTISPVNTMVFGPYFCNNFDYDDISSPPTISNLDYNNCAAIDSTTVPFTSAILQSEIDNADPLLLYLPQIDSDTKMIIADKAYLPLAVQLTGDTTPTFLVSTGD